MFGRVRRMFMGVAALAALALGGSALANAASSGSSSTQTTTTQSQSQQPPAGGPRDPAAGGHVGANGQREVLLTDGTATKVKEAALAKVSGTLERVETDADHGSPYEAHIRKADGTELEVLVNKNFEVTAVNTMNH